MLCQDGIDGYKPRGNVQYALIEAVWDRLNRPSDVLEVREDAPAYPSYAGRPLQLRTPPTLSNAPMSADQKRMQKAAAKLNWAERDARNRKLGLAGEQYVLDCERASLEAAGRQDLADKVRWVSQHDGDGAGYDILSYTPEAEERLLEVKTTRLGEHTPFYITGNEVKVAEENPRCWRLLRLWDFARSPKGFELSPPAGPARLADAAELPGQLPGLARPADQPESAILSDISPGISRARQASQPGGAGRPTRGGSVMG